MKRAPITMCTAALRRGLNEIKRPAVTASENSTSYVKLVGRIQTDGNKATVCSKWSYNMLKWWKAKERLACFSGAGDPPKWVTDVRSCHWDTAHHMRPPFHFKIASSHGDVRVYTANNQNLNLYRSWLVVIGAAPDIYQKVHMIWT